MSRSWSWARFTREDEGIAGSTPQTVHTLLPVFKKVLARKPLFVTGPMTRAELDELLTLPATGLMIGAYLTD